MAASKKAKASKAAKTKHSKSPNNKMPPPAPWKSSSSRPKPTMSPAHRSSSAAASNVPHRPTSEISISEKHSFELARTVMTATISAIVSLRKVFLGHKFAIRTFDCADPEVTYDAFMNGAKSQFTFEPTDDLLNWKILRRGTNDKAVNKLLDWIENAATDALEKKYLAKLQLAFHSLDDSPISDDNLIEAYTMCFTYENGELHIGTAEGKDAPTNTMVLRDAKAGLYSLIDDVLLIIQRRAPLPADRRMNMMLLYNSTCPQDYEPPGFHATRGHHRLIAGNTGAEIGSTNTGFHSISVNVYQQQPQYAQIFQSSSKRRRTRLHRHSTSSEIDGGETQRHGLKLLQSMGNYRMPATQDTQIVSGPTAQSAARNKVFSPVQELTPVFLPYSQTIMERIGQIRGNKGARQVDYDSDGRQTSEHRVTCECGASADEGHLIRCDLCNESKHIQCYGHLGSVPAAAKFACYNCLLDIEGMLLSQMKATCVKRRALYYLHEQHGILHSIEDLAQYLECDDVMTRGILDMLERHGYVERAAGYEKACKGKGKGRCAEPLFTLIADDKMLTGTIFRPELDIPHKLLVPSSTPPESVTCFENGVEDSEPDLTVRSISLSPKSARVQQPVLLTQATRAEVSKTEEIQRSRSMIGRRFSGHRSEVQTPSPLSVGTSHLSKKRGYDSTPEPELDRSVQQQPGASEGGSQDLSIRRKLSEVNSPWTFRSSAA